MIGSQFVVPFVPPPRGLVPVERRLAARPSCLHETSHRGHPARTTLLSGYQPPFPGDQAPGGDAAGEGQQAKWCAPQGKMACAAGKMVCATRQNDVRSWQNGVRAISDGADVLGKMMCALMCALVCALMCAQVAGVPVAQRISNFCLRHLVTLALWGGGVNPRNVEGRSRSPRPVRAAATWPHFCEKVARLGMVQKLACEGGT